MNSSRLSSSVAFVIKKRRTELGLSQERFADLCKLDRTYISAIECGKRNLTLTTLDRIISNLSINYDEFLNDVSRKIYSGDGEQ